MNMDVRLQPGPFQIGSESLVLRKTVAHHFTI